ncbi:MAG TPA: universal stress protein [Solirubrobacteraceae bacterium]|nr:universal stress protein [Solirubrobacteraceae bacterium]
MSTKIVVSYDGTANEDDAIALGRLLGGAGADVALAYVRHSQDPDLDREKLAQSEAEELLARGASLYGEGSVARHVVTDRSTPEGLRALAESEGADVVVFCSDSHTANGHISIGNSAQQLLEGGPVAVAIAPVGFADAPADIRSVVAIGDADGGARATAESLASALGASVAPVANEDADLLVVDSRTEAEQGRVAISASAAHVVEIARCPVLVLPRGRALAFGRSPVTVGA